MSAQITLEVPWGDTGIPFSLQSIAVLLIGWYLPVRQSALLILCYWLLGAIGLPVFADGASGIDVLLGGSGGFLHGFLWSAVFLGIWKKRTPAGRYRAPLGFLLATFVLFFFGLLRLTMLFDFGRAVTYGLSPFWVMALVKVIVLWGLAAVIDYVIQRNEVT